MVRALAVVSLAEVVPVLLLVALCDLRRCVVRVGQGLVSSLHEALLDG